MPYSLTPQQVLASPTASVLIFHNVYPEGKQGGFEIIQHGLRIVTNGDLRLAPAPGQWAPLPRVQGRQVQDGQVSVQLAFPEPEIHYSVRVAPRGEQIELSVVLDQPLPASAAGRVGFNLELLPSALWGKGFFMDDTAGVFPRQANGPSEAQSSGLLLPAPLARGRRLVVAPEDPACRLEIEARDEMLLLDGRGAAHNGWFILWGLLPAGQSGEVLRWTITPGSIPGWQRPPQLLVSQVGYHPEQEKQALLELDPSAAPDQPCRLLRLRPGGPPEVALEAQPEDLGRFLALRYARFDFSSVRAPGLYQLQYGEVTSPPFQLRADIYQQGIWQPTLETFLPVQMCHVRVEDGARVWHGACHLDDALQAPPDHEHFDGYRQYPEPDSDFAPYAHVPGLDQGGWHDAGDYDLAAGSQASTTLYLALAREAFGLDSDQTTVDIPNRLVQLHVPDGVPDILQQVAHGVQSLLTGYRIAGHSFTGIIESNLKQYTHLGDAATMTDNQVTEGAQSEDRWVFTNRQTALEYQVAAALAAAARVLPGYDAALAEECLATARRVWDFEHSHPPVDRPNVYFWNNIPAAEVMAAVELLLATGDQVYAARLVELLPVIEQHFANLGWAAARALAQVTDDTFRAGLQAAALRYRAQTQAEMEASPFRLPLGEGWLNANQPEHDPFAPNTHPPIWGIGWSLQSFAVHYYYLLRAYPEAFEREPLLRVLNFVLGWHPANNLSLVSGVGAQSLTAAYGTNRAEESYIPGGVASGPALLRPNWVELLDPFVWLWQQKEYVISGAATYLFLVLAADDLLNR